MGNENLANALRHAGITEEQLADRIGVDPKSVQRWLAGTTTPYPRHRAAIAQTLELTEQQLWPQTPITQTEQQAGGDSSPAAVNEVTGAWAHATDHGAPDPIELINNTTGPIDLLDSDLTPLLTPDLVAALRRHANTGHRVRLLASVPDVLMIPLIGHPHTEIRVIDASFRRSLIHTGDTILLGLFIEVEGDQSPPCIQLDRTLENGLFDRFANNYELLWEEAQEAITEPGQLVAYLTNNDVREMNEREGNSLSSAEAAGPGITVPADGAAAATADRSTGAEPPRRWPRRPA